MDLRKIQIETNSGMKSLVKCSDEEFEQFLTESGVDIKASGSGWPLTQREMVVGLMCDAFAEIMTLADEGDDDE